MEFPSFLKLLCRNLISTSEILLLLALRGRAGERERFENKNLLGALKKQK